MLECALLLTLTIGAAKPAVAVFEVEDRGARIRASTRRQLGTFLAARIAQGPRYSVIPRAELEKVLRDQKKASYKQCYDEACQIEIGRALAAAKSLHTQIGRVGKRCLVTSTLFDLRTEASERAATRTTTCDPDALLEAFDAIGAELAGASAPRPESKPASPEATAQEVELSSPGSKTEAFIGVTPLGASPVRATLRPGRYVVSFQGANDSISAQTIDVADAPLRLQPQLHKARAPECKRPAWVDEGSGAQSATEVYGLGVFSGAATPAASLRIAEARAVVEAARQLEVLVERMTASFAEDVAVGAIVDAPSSKLITAQTLYGASITERFRCGETAFARAHVAATKPPTAGSTLWITGRGAGDVVTFGASGADVEKSAEIAAYADLLARAAGAVKGLKVQAMMKIRGNVEEDHDTEETLRLSLAATLAGAGAKVVAKGLTSMFAREAVKSGARTFEQTHSDVLRVTFEGAGGRGELRLLQGGLLPGTIESPSRTASQLASALEALGVSRCRVKRLPRIAEAPSAAVTCALEVSEAWLAE